MAARLSGELLDAASTTVRLPWPVLEGAVREVLRDASVQVPPRLVQPLPGGAAVEADPDQHAGQRLTASLDRRTGRLGGPGVRAQRGVDP